MSSNQTLISIIIPTYKGETTLEKLIKELIQVFEKYKIEIIIEIILLIYKVYSSNSIEVHIALCDDIYLPYL